MNLPIFSFKVHFRLGRAFAFLFFTCLTFSFSPHFNVLGQAENFTAVRAGVDFSKSIREWDGFGFNYVETAQTLDYSTDPQEYGGFSLLDESEKQEIIDLVFGENGLKVGIVKMFLDPWHQSRSGGAFDHRSSTENMRYFVREGLKKTRARGGDFEIITTLYGPPAYMTKQKFLRGRDFDPNHKEDLANYLIDWVKFLKNEEKLPIKYLSLNNEGEDWWRWPADGKSGNIGHGHDYNMYWPPELVTEMVKYLRERLDAEGLQDIGITNGEPSNWYRFSTWGYATAFQDDKKALDALGIVTSHGFYNGGYRNRWFGPHTSEGIDLLREKRPGLKAWVTSTSWSNMDAKNVKEMHGNIYNAKVNAIVPWAGIQRPPQWVGGDPNPGSAFTVYESGNYDVRRGYYFYKQVSRAGQPGMTVVRTTSMDSQVAVIGFGANGTKNQDAIIVTNWSDENKKISVAVDGIKSKSFTAFRTTEAGNLNKERYMKLADQTLKNGKLVFDLPAGAVVTFFAR